MPLNFAEVWLMRVIMLFTSTTSAPWLDGIEELNVDVVEIGSGSASESNLIHIPTSDFSPDVLINNTTYPIPVQSFTDSEVIIQLDKYQTKATSLSDDQIIGASYGKIDAATKKHVEKITASKYGKAIHAIAPGTNTADTPILAATGADDGTGRLRLTYEDLVKAKKSLDDMDSPEMGRRLVLSTDHWNDLLLDRERFANLLVDHNTGKANKMIAGFEIYSYVANPYFSSAGVKRAFGAIPTTGDRKASVFFLTSNMVKKTGMTKQYFDKAENNPTTQANLLNYRHYFICLPVRQKYIGVIY